ncbi:hypothetical protein OE88DRAFT_1661332 [Heliocybe sulcata]|uniref:DUF6533 domain-containing protein n=1 Tax=Heliocybe sulcata TaxID=5364 RepID=A0A5C3MYI2_9AGAM|nr:hypothetical protein OE88DRAFT_1661332 [Heliocybe sulcata]
MINLSAAAATTWLVYDIVITLDQEIKFTWRSRWTIPKSLYIIVRYFTLANMLLYLIVNTNTNAPLAVGSVKMCHFWKSFVTPNTLAVQTLAILLVFFRPGVDDSFR